MRLLTPPGTAASSMAYLRRVSLPSAVDDRLYFAQVREDPRLEIEALEPSAEDSIVVVGSGGCTALSLLAAGAGQVTAVDMNRAQNHLIELKLAALTVLSRAESLALLGVTQSSALARLDTYEELRAHLTPEAIAYWDARRGASATRSVMDSGTASGSKSTRRPACRLSPRRRCRRTP